MKLLIVDDDSVSRAALRSIIGEPYGWEIAEAEDGQEALDLLCDGWRADVAILDLKMPRLSGAEFLQRVRRDPDLRRLKVVVSSAVRDRDTVLALAKLQISGYLLKPYDAAKTKAVLMPLLPRVADPLKASRDLLSKTALVTEDDPAARAELETYLRSRGWTVAIAKDGLDVLDRLRAGDRPDLLLIGLPGRPFAGAELLRQIRQGLDLEGLRIAVLATEADPGLLRELKEHDVVGCVHKPWSPETLAGLFERIDTDRVAA